MLGQTISHYKILEKLGEGGMGVVYKAEDTKLKRMVAIKFLPKTLSVHGEERERFALEAQAASALNHPNVATIYEIDEADGETFIVMEYVEGTTLRELAGGSGHSPEPLKRIVDIGVQIAEGLAAAHEKGIVHRDVKPENIMMRKDGRVQVMDFGLAKLRGVSKLTKMGSTIGTIAYMSPEQVQGIETDHRTDIFSLGVLLYELLTGQLPFKGGHEAALMYEIVNTEPPLLSSMKPEVGQELERIIMKCLEKDREERYHSVKDVAVDLRHFRRDSAGRSLNRKTPVPGTSQVPFAAPAAAAPEPKKGMPPWIKAASGAVVLLIIGVVAWQLMKPPSEVALDSVFKPLQVPFTTIWYPGLSADGNWIAFPATDANTVTEIYYMHASGGEPKSLTNDSLWKFVADISPDGSTIVYSAGLSRAPLSFPVRLMTVSTLGGPVKKLADGGNGPRWSPDGKSIAYITGAGGGAALRIMDADGGNKRTVMSDSLAQRVSLAWSPDGKSIAWLRTFREGGNVYQEIIIRDLEAGTERRITDDKRNIDEVYWLPKDEILYSSNRSGPSNLWKVPAKGGVPVQVTKGPGPDLGIKASRDGKRILYLQQAAFGSLQIADAEGLNPRQITPDDKSVFGPRFSPDGKQIAFLVNDEDPIKPLVYFYIVDRDGKARRQLTTAGENIEDFVWSPDGRKIAYTVHLTTEIDTAHTVEIMDLADPSQKKAIGKGRAIGWSRDGKEVNVLRNRTSWLVPLAGGPDRKVYEDSTAVIESPEGEKVAILDSRAKSDGVWIRAKEKPLRKILDGTIFFSWFPDGKRLRYTKNDELWEVSTETNKVRRYPWKNSESVAFNDLSPDGKQTLYVRQRMNGKLILIDNFH